ncbi:hypothetical protein D1818_05355 [Aquimarina sp. BL5]|uniref:hypothetical protein n=1 Tax=Aquimarina sp. BL5 TaxID=1714860 RepID=UPI000E4BF97B|nr:hypothetical protein [Aquimarina sp. BL5]AXT50283.1 hypothetical protein D1818_05355 [Aquimarina sp. BL5]RKN07147.1 hypothetical protein D7036_07890 [Aquimarina sp. BL5]
MIPSKYKFRTQEIQLNIPREGTHKYLIESTNFINYSGEIRCSHKKEVSFSIQYNEDQPYIRFVQIEIQNDSFKFSDGSFAMQDIIKRTASVYKKLHLQVSYKGQILSIDNIEELQENWHKTKMYFESKYKGNQIQRFILKTDTILNSEEEIIKDISLYHNFGGLIKSMYQKYSSDSCSNTSQYLSTKYGKINTEEDVLLQSAKETEDVQLQLQSHYPKNEEYVSVNGTYNFKGILESWLQRAVISSIEKYGRQEYHNTVSIIQL